MPYQIELMSLGGDYYSVLKAAADGLNGVQDQFRFHLTAVNQQPAGIGFKRGLYKAPDVWDFLENNRNASGGNRPHIIAFVNAPLESNGLKNIFGTREEGKFAVVTLNNFDRFVKAEKRFCGFYMVRYAISFVNPSIMSHNLPNDEARKKCYFHKKIYKPDIVLAMESACICDVCRKQLDSPTPVKGTRLSAEEHEAIEKMMALISGDFPHAIVMKGGGVKGLALAGALVELDNYFAFNRHVGTSAGAIAATLLAAGYKPQELVDILSKKKFTDFLDARFWMLPINLLFRQGFYPGNHFQEWIAGLIGSKNGNIAETKMSQLNGAVLYASRMGPGTVVFDSNGERSHTVAAFATRCSMSIPIFFIPKMLDDRRTYDGGMRTNFPLKRFLEDHKGKPFVGIYLGKRDDRNKRWMPCEWVDIWMDGEEREVVDANRSSLVVIDTSPIGTVDFRMTEEEKKFLLQVGRAAALRFIFERKFHQGPAEQAVIDAEKEAENTRIGVIAKRKSRGLRRCGIFLGFVLLAECGWLLWKFI